jgi:hypothetical protein
MKGIMERDYSTLVLRLLLDGELPGSALDGIDWSLLLRTAARNDVLLRLAERLTGLEVQPPGFFGEAVALERRRVDSGLELAQAVSRACKAHGLEFVFPKATQHWPDLGSDLDLLVLSPSLEVDQRILEGLPARAKRRDLGSRVAGAAAYDIIGSLPLDIQHARLGVAGEHVTFARELVRHGYAVDLGGVELFTASPNDRIVLQGLQRVYGRHGIQLCDVIYTIGSIRRNELDWDYIVAAAGRIGILAGLSCYLGYVEQIHRSLYGLDLPFGPARPALRLHGWGRVRFRRYQYRYPTLGVNGRLYGRHLGFHIAGRNWRGAARVCLIPAIAAERALRRLTRGGWGAPDLLGGPLGSRAECCSIGSTDA